LNRVSEDGGEGAAETDRGPEEFTRELARWSETLAAIARTGLGFSENLYERERFEEVLHVAADMKVAVNQVLGSTLPPEEAQEVAREQDHFVQEWLESVGVGVPGYVTPKVAIGAIVGNDDGELLLVQRADSKIWLYPTGWADVGYSPAEVAVKEVLEETGIQAEVTRVVAVIDGQRMGFSRFGMYMLLFHLRAVGGELRCHPLECSDVGWFGRDALPEKTAGAQWWRDMAFSAIDGEPFDTLYDEVRSPIWRS
jgi:ADP-ribose pyrophosphatase YjhB (NUDIX family)